MLNAHPADTFFGHDRPAGLPDDSGAADIGLIVDRIRTLEPADYPLPALKAILSAENRRIGSGQATLDAIGHIGTDTVFVVCGQQAGLFGGPLYTLYKAMHAVKLARLLTDRTDRTVLPLFWIASDDHDFNEVSTLGTRAGDGMVSHVPANYREGMPVGDIMLDNGVTDALDSLSELAAGGPDFESYFRLLRESWQPGILWTDAFARQFAGLFADRGLIMFDPRWQGAKALFRDIFKTELVDPLASSALVNEEAEAFENAKLKKKALRRPDGGTNLFHEKDGIRRLVYTDPAGFRAGDRTYTRDELIRKVDSESERFSPAAALRPVCQDAVFPTAALIAGPGERVYLGQLDRVYKLFGVERSIPWPRASFTIIDRKTLRTADKEGIAPAELFADIDHIRNLVARESFPPKLEETFAAAETALDGHFDNLAAVVGSIDPTLTDAVRKEKGKVLHSVEALRQRTLRSHKARLTVSEKRLASASSFLLPGGEPQERRYGIDAVLSVLAGEGFGDLLAMTSPGENRHRIIVPAE